MRATKSSGDVWRGESQAQRLCGSVGVFVTRAWTCKSWLPLAVLWGSAASQILIKTGEKGKFLSWSRSLLALLRCRFAMTVFP